ncbi:PstS family phosphate ABC transporter substrate-binding protein [Psychromonas ossibalaenae]|uniref:PstS family phosphate ABC transporter substrate-binding protein n=1 Tax=Psychromonas ossibalaenae TaxID=444922 RepID=UPI00037946E3|nr:phosphate ABC transporter substrate-binding protein PstS family protein [Psychromonas ossibalaenae]
MKFKTLAAAAFSAASLFTASAAAEMTLPSYEKVRGVSGNFSSVGSDTLANMMTFWAEEFKRNYPNINIQIQAAGSSTAPPSLTEATSQFGPMSRKMKSKEIEAFEKRYGYKPTPVRVAIDALAVFVNKDNPIEGLTIKQLDAIFSVTHKCGVPKNVLRWADVGLTGRWSGRDMQLFGRNSVSGTYGFFKKKALCKGDFKNSVNEQPGSASVVQSVASSLNSIGYSGIGYQVAGVKAVALSKKGGPFVEASLENAVSGKYPLSRFLYVYVNKHPNKPLSPLQAEFLKMILSQQGQAIVKKDGYIPLPGSIAAKELAKLGLN